MTKFNPFLGFDLSGYALNGNGVIEENFAHIWIFHDSGKQNFVSYFDDMKVFGKERNFVFSVDDPVLLSYLQELLERNLKLQAFL